MDTSIYRYAVAVADCKSISGASKKLFISQPALTKHIRRLEDELNVKLFDRSRTPLAVTPEGEIFVEYARKYLELEQELMERMAEKRGSEIMHVRIASTNRGGHYAGEKAAGFLEAYPHIHLEFLDMNASECETALEDETAELAFYTSPVLSSKVEYMPVEEDPLVLVVPQNSSVLEGKAIGENSPSKPFSLCPEELRRPDLTFIVSTQNHSLYYAEQDFFEKYKIAPAKALKVDYVDTRYAIACGGAGIVLVPLTTIKNDRIQKDIVFCCVNGEPMYRYVIIAKKKGRALSKGAAFCWKFMVGSRFEHP